MARSRAHRGYDTSLRRAPLKIEEPLSLVTFRDGVEEPPVRPVRCPARKRGPKRRAPKGTVSVPCPCRCWVEPLLDIADA
jgi:hypothetical protein